MQCLSEMRDYIYQVASEYTTGKERRWCSMVWYGMVWVERKVGRKEQRKEGTKKRIMITIQIEDGFPLIEPLGRDVHTHPSSNVEQR